MRDRLIPRISIVVMSAAALAAAGLSNTATAEEVRAPSAESTATAPVPPTGAVPPAGTPSPAGTASPAPGSSDAGSRRPVPEVADPDSVSPGLPREDGLAVDADESAAAGQPAGTGPASAETVSKDSDAVEVETGSGLFEESLSTSPSDSAAAETQEGALASSIDINGHVRGDVFIGKVPGFAAADIKAGYGELALEFRATRGTFGSAFAETRLRMGQQGEVRDLFVDLREAYVDAYVGDLDVRFGHQIIVWGRADAFNPTNNLTPFDLRVRSPVEDDRRVGNLALRLRHDLSPFRLEGVWLPLFVPVEFPLVTIPEYVTLVDPNFPAPEVLKGTVGAKVDFEVPAVEMSLSYVHGYAPLPGLALSGFSVGADAEIRIARTAYNHHVVGFDFSTTIGDELGVRGEAAYRRPLRYDERAYAPNPDLQYVVGVDRAFGAVNVIAQYAGRYVFDWQSTELPEDALPPSALEEIDAVTPLVEETIVSSVEARLAQRNQALFQQLEEVQHIASLRLEWLTLHDTLTLSSLGLLNFSTQEWLLYPKAQYRITDGMSTSVGGEIYGGPEETLLGLIAAPLSAGYVELRVDF